MIEDKGGSAVALQAAMTLAFGARPEPVRLVVVHAGGADVAAAYAARLQAALATERPDLASVLHRVSPGPESGLASPMANALIEAAYEAQAVENAAQTGNDGALHIIALRRSLDTAIAPEVRRAILRHAYGLNRPLTTLDADEPRSTVDQAAKAIASWRWGVSPNRR